MVVFVLFVVILSQLNFPRSSCHSYKLPGNREFQLHPSPPKKILRTSPLLEIRSTPTPPEHKREQTLTILSILPLGKRFYRTFCSMTSPGFIAGGLRSTTSTGASIKPGTWNVLQHRNKHGIQKICYWLYLFLPRRENTRCLRENRLFFGVTFLMGNNYGVIRTPQTRKLLRTVSWERKPAENNVSLPWKPTNISL